MAWTKLKDIFATKKEINEVRDSLSHISYNRLLNFSNADFNDYIDFFGAVYTRNGWTLEQHAPVNMHPFGYLFAMNCYDSYLQIFIGDNKTEHGFIIAIRSKYNGSVQWTEWMYL